MSVKRIAVGGVLFEGNTFSKVRTELVDFENKYLVVGDAMIDALGNTNVEVAGAFSAIDAAGLVDCAADRYTWRGRGTRNLRVLHRVEEIAYSGLQSVGPIDGVYLALHGAMICEGEDDAEGDILSSVRAVIGDMPLSVSCDMHAHITKNDRRLLDPCWLSALSARRHF